MSAAPSPPLPILYSFRRCPYAMRARMALMIAGVTCELREVKLAEKPQELFDVSPKATVPVLVLGDGTVLEESLDIMRWALARNDPENWLSGDDAGLIERNDNTFKHHLDRYKYPTRYPEEVAKSYGDDEDTFRYDHRTQGLIILQELDARLGQQANLTGSQRSLADIALFPFIRQFANTDRTWFDDQGIAHLHEWLERHLASDLFATIMPKFTPWKSGDEIIKFAEQKTG